ncbi:efflux RND transporter periplasmic adaptor subunit [Massilia sp. H6]|uniref:efflux RND transporter periplasmic adaptor subunit n=1 Tax=Massilia sp. H6 TaxID=2970464 RepID=UPI002168FDAD|nr:efflux RND transporter periplasmic adaptor subunit [Massilia sp. H6]UVW30055.1 efflux RND transporter periplasmic adaptor subunit [Massilia sp. H6]
MTSKQRVLALGLAALVAGGGAGLYWLGMHRGMGMAAPAAEPGAAAGERKVLYWHDPMVPGQRFDKPGKSPFMDMQLVPVYDDAAGDGNSGTVTISPHLQQNLGMRVAKARMDSFAPELSAVGSVAYNERDVALVQARASGFVEQLFVRAPLDPVRKGQALAALYVPDWVAAQEEFLAARRMGDGAPAGLVDAARQRMRLAGMTDAHIRQVEARGRVQARITVTAPIAGVIAELTAREGMTVSNGAPLFRINGLSTVWIVADIPETLAAQVQPGNAVEARAPALPDMLFKGKVSTLLPRVDPATRTLQARVEIANPGQRLVPGMFASVHFTPAARAAVLTIPSEALIQTGKRSVVMLALGDGKFRPVEVRAGVEADGRTEILEGLQEGQEVVVSGQFLIDSEASLRATQTRAAPAPAAPADKGATTHRGEGKIERIDQDEVTLSHGPIPSMQWPPMTMGFSIGAATLPAGLAVGDTVSFSFELAKDGTYKIVAITPMPPARPDDKKAPQ